MTDWTTWLAHDPTSPWTFLEGNFWVFLLLVLVLDAVWNRDRQRALRHFWLLMASLLFYWKPRGGLCSFCSSPPCRITSSATASTRPSESRRKDGSRQASPSTWACCSISHLLPHRRLERGHGDTSFRGTGRHGGQCGLGHLVVGRPILPPVGISFYTFQTISYTVDIYRREVQPLQRLSDFGFYVSFFPNWSPDPLFALQILRPKSRALPKSPSIPWASRVLILNGLLKKALLAD